MQRAALIIRRGCGAAIGGVVFATVLWMLAPQEVRSACNVSGTIFAKIEIESIDHVCKGATKSVGVLVSGTSGTCPVTLTDSGTGSVHISPATQTCTANVTASFTIEGETESDSANDVTLKATIVGGVEVPLGGSSCEDTETLSVVKAEIEPATAVICTTGANTATLTATVTPAGIDLYWTIMDGSSATGYLSPTHTTGTASSVFTASGAGTAGVRVCAEPGTGVHYCDRADITVIDCFTIVPERRLVRVSDTVGMSAWDCTTIAGVLTPVTVSATWSVEPATRAQFVSGSALVSSIGTPTVSVTMQGVSVSAAVNDVTVVATDSAGVNSDDETFTVLKVEFVSVMSNGPDDGEENIQTEVRVFPASVVPDSATFGFYLPNNEVGGPGENSPLVELDNIQIDGNKITASIKKAHWYARPPGQRCSTCTPAGGELSQVSGYGLTVDVVVSGTTYTSERPNDIDEPNMLNVCLPSGSPHVDPPRIDGYPEIDSQGSAPNPWRVVSVTGLTRSTTVVDMDYWLPSSQFYAAAYAHEAQHVYQFNDPDGLAYETWDVSEFYGRIEGFVASSENALKALIDGERALYLEEKEALLGSGEALRCSMEQEAYNAGECDYEFRWECQYAPSCD